MRGVRRLLLIGMLPGATPAARFTLLPRVECSLLVARRPRAWSLAAASCCSEPACREALVIATGCSSGARRAGGPTSALSRPWRSSGEFEGARRSVRSGALALSLALGRRLFEQYPKIKQYDSSVTSDRSRAVYIALSGMAKNICYVLVWRPEHMAPRAGLEPAAYCLGGSRSIRLSYRGLTGPARVHARPRAAPSLAANSPRHSLGIQPRRHVRAWLNLAQVRGHVSPDHRVESSGPARTGAALCR